MFVPSAYYHFYSGAGQLIGPAGQQDNNNDFDRSDTNNTDYAASGDTFDLYNLATQQMCQIDLVSFLVGSAACEMPAVYDDEAIKAQMIACHSYYLYCKENGVPDEDMNLSFDERYMKKYASKQKLRSVLYTVVLLLVCLVSMAVMVFASPLEKFITEFLDGRFSWLLAVINMHNILLFTSLWMLFAFAYKSLAKNPLSFRNQLFGAAVAAAGWILYTFGYSVYIRYFSRYSTLYGAFGAVMLFMLWLYMCMNILLCGALINKIKNDNLLCGGIFAEKNTDCD